MKWRFIQIAYELKRPTKDFLKLYTVFKVVRETFLKIFFSKNATGGIKLAAIGLDMLFSEFGMKKWHIPNGWIHSRFIRVRL